MPFTENREPRIDVDRASIVRLVKFARDQSKQCDEQSLGVSATYWDGYVAGLQEVLRMEHQ